MTTAKFGPETAGRWTDEAYADPQRYLRRRAELVRSLGPPLQAGDTVLDLACGDAGLAEYLLPTRAALRRRRCESGDGRRRAAPGSAASRRSSFADLDEFEPRSPVAATTVFRAPVLRPRPCGVPPSRGRLHRAEARLRPRSAALPARRRQRRAARGGLDLADAPPVLRAADRTPAGTARAGTRRDRTNPAARRGDPPRSLHVRLCCVAVRRRASASR